MEKQFSKKEALRAGWETTRQHIGLLCLVLLIVIGIGIVLDILSDILREAPMAVKTVTLLATGVLALMAEFGLLRIMLRLADNESMGLKDLISQPAVLGKYIAATLVYWTIVLGGLFLLIVPGIIWAIKFGFYPYVILDKGVGPIAALRESSCITQDAKLELFFFQGLLMAINILGVIAFIVGLLVTIPVTMIASAFVYRRLSALTASALFATPPLEEGKYSAQK